VDEESIGATAICATTEPLTDHVVTPDRCGAKDDRDHFAAMRTYTTGIRGQQLDARKSGGSFLALETHEGPAHCATTKGSPCTIYKSTPQAFA
jgi:hypothetical protein